MTTLGRKDNWSKLQAVVGTASKLLGKRHFLSVRKESTQNVGLVQLTQWITVMTWMGKKRAFGGRNEDYPSEDSRVNIQEGPEKVHVLNHPGSRYQGKKKHPWSSLQHSPASQVVAEKESVKTGQVSGLPPRRGMEESGQDQAPLPSATPWGAAAGRDLAACQDRSCKGREEFFCFALVFCLFLNTNSISQWLYSCLHSLAAVNTVSLLWYLWIRNSSCTAEASLAVGCLVCAIQFRKSPWIFPGFVYI